MDQSSKTPSRCIYYKATNRQNPFPVRLPLICTGKGFDDLFLFTKGNGEGFGQWEGVLCFMAL